MKTKYIPNIYSLFDTGVLARKLEKMARKGWHFKEIIPRFLVFEEGEPMEVSYATPYFPNNSVLEPKLTAEHEAYLEMCEQQGWELVWTFGTRQIFRNTRPDPVPIETDSMVQLKAIGAGVGRYLFICFSPLIFCLPFLFLFMQEYQIFGSINGLIKTKEIILLWTVIFLPAIFGLIKIVWYFIWFAWSYNRVQKGKPILPTLFYPRLVLDVISVLPLSIFLFKAIGPVKMLVFLAIALPLDLLWWRYYQNGKKYFKSKEQVYFFLLLSNLLIFNLAEELAAKLILMLP